MAEKRRYKISINGRLVEVSKEVYTCYYRMGRRERYIEERDFAHGKTLYSQLDNGETTGEGMLPDFNAIPVEEIVIGRIMADRLRSCLLLLTVGELALIVKRYYEDRSQSEVAAESGISQSKVCRKEKLILAKLRKMLEV